MTYCSNEPLGSPEDPKGVPETPKPTPSRPFNPVDGAGTDPTLDPQFEPQATPGVFDGLEQPPSFGQEAPSAQERETGEDKYGEPQQLTSRRKFVAWLGDAFEKEKASIPNGIGATCVSLPLATLVRHLTSEGAGSVLSGVFASLSSLSWYPVFFGLSYVQDRREILAPDGSINKEKQKALFQAYLAIFGSMEVVWQGVYMLAQPILEKATGMGEEVSTVVTHATLAAIFTFGLPVIKHAWKTLFSNRNNS